MILNSFPFLVFISLVLIIYWKIPQKYRWLVLLLAGYYFYASWKAEYLILIVVSTVINYYLSISINSAKKNKKNILLIALVFNLLLIFAFKYFNLFSNTLNQSWRLFNWQFRLPQFSWLVPLGISFYTLQTIGYFFDIYNGKIKPEKQFRFFALFQCFFPQLSAGPIMRGNTLLPKLKNLSVFDYNRVSSGLKLFTYGLFKKMVIADNLGIVTDRVFGSLAEYKGLSLVLAVIIYGWQIYYDFSGYTDMARGIGRMLGIELMENFNFPYFATSVRDFWKRWHISLTSWLRDYIYFPLGGNRKGWLKMILSTLIVFTVSGLWHGASWHFVVWGTLNGLWIGLERTVKNILGKSIHFPRFLQVSYTYLLVSIFWIFFKTESVADALYVIRSSVMGIRNFFQPSYIWATLNQLFFYNKAEMIITFTILFIAVSVELLRKKASISLVIARQPAIVRYVFYTVLAFLIIQLRNSDIKAFIYTRF